MLYNVNINNGRQNIASFISPTKRTIKSIDRRMLENSRASNSRVFIGVLSKFPKLKTSVFWIAGQRFIRWIRVIRSFSNLCLNCNHCISIISHIFWTPANKARKTTLNSLFNTLFNSTSYHPPPGHTPGDLQFFSHLAVYSPPPGTQKETIPHPRDSSSTTNTLFCSKTRRFGKNFNYFSEFIERRILYKKNMNTIFEKENWRKSSSRTAYG